MYNKIIFAGNLGKDPEGRYVPSGTAVTTFSVASNRKWTKDGEKHEETTWFTVECWGNLAEICNQYLSKGSKVLVDGRMKPPRPWIGDDGTARCNLEVTANEVVFLSGKEETVKEIDF